MCLNWRRNYFSYKTENFVLFHTSKLDVPILSFYIRDICAAPRNLDNQVWSQKWKKISALINNWGNKLQSEALADKCGSFHTLNSWWIWGRGCRKCIRSFKPENSIYSSQTDTKLVYLYTLKYKFFLLKTDILIINWLPISYAHVVPERLSSPSDKRELQKSQFPNS